MSGAITSLGRLLAGSPGEFRRPAFDRVPMYDGCDQDVDDESTGGVRANAEARAILQWSDHFQAGLTATLTLYPTAEACSDAIDRALSSHREEYAEVEDEGYEVTRRARTRRRAIASVWPGLTGKPSRIANARSLAATCSLAGRWRSGLAMGAGLHG